MSRTDVRRVWAMHVNKIGSVDRSELSWDELAPGMIVSFEGECGFYSIVATYLDETPRRVSLTRLSPLDLTDEYRGARWRPKLDFRIVQPTDAQRGEEPNGRAG